MEKRYMISDAAKRVEVEAHVLRYWEEELELKIPRNEMGHRYYRDQDIKLLQNVRDLKEQGFQLKAIKMVLPNIGKLENMDSRGIYQLREQLNRQVLREEGSGSVTPIAVARSNRDKKLHPAGPEWENNVNELADNRLAQFQEMLKTMIEETMKQVSEEYEERMCQEITTKLQKELSYLMRQKEELQEQQIALLQKLVSQSEKGEMPQVAATREEGINFFKKLFAKLV